MINIIKDGNVEKLKMIRRFECKECGCVFECEKDEYQAEAFRNDIIFYAECPMCRKRAYHVVIR